ncbi:hypothetical protein FRC01_004314 [Tulasnella sp. 417]|nr:hypothetical protein FRC01_004314 [Tulasnella sp. 417]
MSIDNRELWDDQNIKDYLKQEIEFLKAFAVKVENTNYWRSIRGRSDGSWSSIRTFLATIKDWTKVMSQISQVNALEAYSEEILEDPTDSPYEDICAPTSFYRWTYFNLGPYWTRNPFNPVYVGQCDELVRRMFRTQLCDAEIFGSGSQYAYPPEQEDRDLRVVPEVLSLGPQNANRASSTFIHQLPPEILSEIFITACDGSPYIPIVVSHVDSHFRAIAESTALLWARIDINLPLPLLSLFLERSNSVLLDVQIDLRYERWIQGGTMPPPLRTFLAMVRGHRERIASLSISACETKSVDDIVESMLEGPGSTYPHLRKLDIGCPIWFTEYDHQSLERPIVVPPKLQELSLWGARLRNWVVGFTGPLEGLKSLCLANNVELFLSDVLIVLATLPNLETMVIQDCTIEEDPLAAPKSAVTLSNLTTLQYITLSHKSIAFLQQALRSPKLISLKLWWARSLGNSSDQAQPLVRMLRANPQLETLDLCNCVIQQSGWREAFSGARSLKKLRLLSCELESDGLDFLLEPGIGEDVEQCLLPGLEHLTLDNVFQLTTNVIRQIVTQRPGIRTLQLRGWDGSNVVNDDVQFIHRSVGCFTLEMFYKGSSTFEEEERDEESEEWSSSGTLSEGPWW